MAESSPDPAPTSERNLNDAAEILAVLKCVEPERRTDVLAIACRVFCDTNGTIELADA